MLNSILKCYVVLVALLSLTNGLRADQAEIVLRQRAARSGPMIRLGDVADISAAAPERLHDLSTTPLLPAPAPGTREFLNRTRLRDLLKSRGVDLRQLAVSGAQVVEIGDGPDPALKPIEQRRPQPIPAKDAKPVQMTVVVVNDVAVGDLLGVSDVQLRAHEGRPSANYLTTLDQAIGMEARRRFNAGSRILRNQLRKPRKVLRGETVTIFARTGGISVKTYATARQDGALGDLIQVESLDKKERYTAHISGRRELEVLATGKNIKELVTLKNRSARH